MSNKAMYILVNNDIKIKKGKLAGQVSHAVCSYLYNHFISAKAHPTSEELKDFDDYMVVQKKILLKCPQSKLEELEASGFITIRDKGLTQLAPNTLTCVNYGIYDKMPESLADLEVIEDNLICVCYGVLDRDNEEVPDWIKELKLYN